MTAKCPTVRPIRAKPEHTAPAWPRGAKGHKSQRHAAGPRGRHSRRWCATGAPLPVAAAPWRGSYADSQLSAPSSAAAF